MINFTTIGKYLFLVPFLMFGINHFRMADMMSGMVPSYFPGGSLWVYITGLGMLAFVASALFGKFDKLAAVLTAAMCLIFALTVHLPGMLDGSNPMAIVSLLKDVGLAGGALLYTGYAKDNSVIG